MHTLKALCDIRLDRDDMRAAIEAAMAEEGGADTGKGGAAKGVGKGGAPTKAGAKPVAPPPPPPPVSRTSRRAAAAAPAAGQKPGGKGGATKGGAVSPAALQRQPLGGCSLLRWLLMY